MIELKRNEDGSITTTKASLRRVIVFKLLDKTSADLNDQIEQKIKNILDSVIQSDNDYEAVTIKAESVKTLIKKIDSFTESEMEM